VHGGVVCIFETHRKAEEVIDRERGFGLPGRQPEAQEFFTPRLRCRQNDMDSFN